MGTGGFFKPVSFTDLHLNTNPTTIAVLLKDLYYFTSLALTIIAPRVLLQVTDLFTHRFVFTGLFTV